MGLDISSRSYFQEVIGNEISTYTTPEAIVSKDTGNTTLVHSVKDVDLFFQQIVDSREPVLKETYTFDASVKSGSFVKVPTTDWIVCLAIAEVEALRPIRRVQQILIISLFAFIVLVSLAVFLYIKVRLIRNIKKIEGLMELVSEGDLAVRGHIAGRDEIAGMAVWVNILLDSLDTFFHQLNGNMQDLEDVGSDLSANMEETAAAIYQIRRNVENSLNQIGMQEESVSDTVAVVEEITQNIREQDNNIERQSDNLRQGSSAIEQMIAQAIQEIDSGINEIQQAVVVVTELAGSNRKSIEVVKEESGHYQTGV